MPKSYTYKNHSNISDAMQASNAWMSTPKFTLLDYNLLCLIKSFYDADQPFYMSNEQIARALLSSERAVRYSIERLCSYNFISKELKGNNRSDGKYLIYQNSNVELFIAQMNLMAQK